MWHPFEGFVRIVREGSGEPGLCDVLVRCVDGVEVLTDSASLFETEEEARAERDRIAPWMTHAPATDRTVVEVSAAAMDTLRSVL